MSPDKLRGGFYTPPALVEFCLQRVTKLIDSEAPLRVLEPTAGDGAFVRGLGRSIAGVHLPVADVMAVEVLAAEAAKVELSLRSLDLPGNVLHGSVIEWAAETDEWFDLVVGNPPFVRYQFVSDVDKAAIAALGERLELRFGGVGNLWIPVLLGSLARLVPQGVLSMVLPTECFTGCSAAVVRDWLTKEIEDLTFDLFQPGSFPDVLQEVAVVSGRRRVQAMAVPAEVRIIEHSRGGRSRAWSYVPKQSDRSWTRSFLDPVHLDAVDAACSLPSVAPLSAVARMEVSIVTGANDFFCVDEATVARFDLEPWTRPLLARARHAPGLVVADGDLNDAREAGARSWLLDFAAAGPDPLARSGPSVYLAQGLASGLAGRYKCRIRDPWYRVPSIRAGSLLLSKRSHLFPRLMINSAGAYTTDTIYRGEVLADAPVLAADLVAGFHSSLTLLAVELEGRSFGGGVLELVPSEIARLAVVVHPGLGEQLAHLDRVARAGDPEELVAETDVMLVRNGVLPADLAALLGEARRALMARRLNRNQLGGRITEEWDARAA